MVSVLDQEIEWLVDELTTTPVILQGKVGIDYRLVRRATSSANVSIRSLIYLVGAGTVDYTGAHAGVNGTVPDTPFNRRQLEKDNNADWSYALQFDSGTVIEVALPINNIIISVVWAASSGTIDHNTGLEAAAAGQVGLAGTSGRVIGKPLAKVTDGTTDRTIAMVLYASAVTEQLVV